MDRADALDRLPEMYAAALRLREGGVDDAGLAELLGIAPEAVGPLLGGAAARLAELLAKDDPP